MAHWTRIHAVLILFLLIRLDLFVYYLFKTEPFSLLDMLIYEELSKNFLRSNVEGLLTVVSLHSYEFNTIILRHNVLLNKFVFWAASKLTKAEFKVDLILNVLSQIHFLYALWIHLKQSENRLHYLRQFLTVIDHLSAWLIRILLWLSIIFSEHKFVHADLVLMSGPRLVGWPLFMVDKVGEWVVHIA